MLKVINETDSDLHFKVIDKCLTLTENWMSYEETEKEK
jgi:hypothetical protein